ncbi:hypothetical protein MtrunA17_Chr2g0302381 [Medicago truncatula]|uniref:Uncharacterized protein n=1 Tax=Medicago truncatula TaxID=3880 RepID=A0A396J9T3_MEDTR|nr:hypothetical protein MtrunA17_Chr2g0302381 [Medicago truncatula]
MVKGKKSAEHIFLSPPHKDNEEVQIIFYITYSKSLLGSDSVERYNLSSYSSPNQRLLRYLHIELLKEPHLENYRFLVRVRS